MRKSKFLAGLLALSLSVLPALSGKPSKGKPDAPEDAKLFQKKLPKDKQVLHALDRLTFGPRPGDVDQVRRLGVKKWIDQQLHPERIAENPVLDAKLQPLESLRMTQAEVVRKYPPPRFIAAVATGRQALPVDPEERAAVQRLVDKYKARKGDTQNLDDMEPRTTVADILSPEQIATLRKGTPDQKRQLANSLPGDKMDDLIIALPRPQRQQLFNFVPAREQRKIMMLNAPQAVLNYDLSEGKIYRAVYSRRQLQELLADFWYNHFNVFLDKGADRYLVPTYEREAIRAHVFGRFRDLLEATAKSPAMLFYLDNWESVAPKPPDTRARVQRPRQTRGLNENYARELMELHTLGVDGGYTQKDIIEVARCFTGWTIKAPRMGGGFEYNDKVHDKGEKVVLGVVIPAGGGMEDGEKVLDILAHHPSTARFISRKLAMRFVSDNPPPALIARMARTFAKTDGDIRATMKTMLDSKEFWSEGAYRAKVKTPFEMIVSAVRALNADVDNAFPLGNQIAQLGQPLYRKVEPTGYSSANADWVNSAALLARMNFALALAQNRVPGVKVDTSRLSQDPTQVAKAVLFQDVSPQTRAAIEKALAENRKPATPAVLAGLVIGSPDFQRR
jgi:uncharacterized protein (DUF1800 family)